MSPSSSTPQMALPLAFVTMPLSAQRAPISAAGKRHLGASHDSDCFVGSAPGAWRGAEAPAWELTATNSSCTPLVRYVWVDPSQCRKRVPSTVPNAGPSNMPSCVQRDQARLVSEIANVSILMLGDSTSAQLLWHTCEAFGVRPKSFVQINSTSHGALKKYNTGCAPSTTTCAIQLPASHLAHFRTTG